MAGKSSKNRMTRHETIKCPKCYKRQVAFVTHNPRDPFPIYVHTCDDCKHVITESEWERVKD